MRRACIHLCRRLPTPLQCQELEKKITQYQSENKKLGPKLVTMPSQPPPSPSKSADRSTFAKSPRFGSDHGVLNSTEHVGPGSYNASFKMQKYGASPGKAPPGGGSGPRDKRGLLQQLQEAEAANKQLQRQLSDKTRQAAAKKQEWAAHQQQVGATPTTATHSLPAGARRDLVAAARAGEQEQGGAPGARHGRPLPQRALPGEPLALPARADEPFRVALTSPSDAH